VAALKIEGTLEPLHFKRGVEVVRVEEPASTQPGVAS
jgi:hypothetical protein